ncbi:MAG: hypothetical protein NWF09_08890 [Candidatus Bathyarchaeota archaeon]|nr:hypothetical protein [Candidatus Bathyarchaeota archaeon]
MYLEVRGVIDKNPVASGWEQLQEKLFGMKRNGRCILYLTYMLLNLEDVSRDQVLLTKVSEKNYADALRLASAHIMNAPKETIELNFIPQQVAAASLLSQHPPIKVVKEGFPIPPSIFQNNVLNILALLYRGAFPMQSYIFYCVDRQVWEHIRRSIYITQDKLPPRECLEILNGNKDKKDELTYFLKMKFTGDSGKKL